jgi:type I restriction enzyme M protein
VVRMMVRLANPQEGMRVYDPCSGSGGMLILSKETRRRARAIQKRAPVRARAERGVWSISK